MTWLVSGCCSFKGLLAGSGLGATEDIEDRSL